MATYRYGWLLLAAALVPAVYSACGGDDSGTPGGGGTTSAGTGGAVGTGGSTGTGGSGTATGGAVGTGGAGTGGAQPVNDAGRIPCGDAGMTCNPAGQGQNRVCDTATGMCVQCLQESDCTGVMNAPHCNTMQTPPRCRQCIVGSTDPALGCPAGQTCTGNGACTVTCTMDTDCAGAMGAPACNTATMRCVECVNDTHCAGNTANGQLHCFVGDAGNNLNNCVECNTNADCAGMAGQPICRLGAANNNNNCVACAVAADCPIPGSTCRANGTCAAPPAEGGAPEAGGPRPDAAPPASDAASGG